MSDLAGDERRSVEQLLGRPLDDDQQVYILAFKPGVIPDPATRRRALAGMRQTLAAAERHASGRGLSDAEIEAAVDEASDRIRYGKH